MKKNACLFFVFLFSIVKIYSYSPIDSLLNIDINKSKKLNFSHTSRGEFDFNYVEENYAKDPKVDSIVTKAKDIFKSIQETGSYVSVLGADDMISLPVGVKKKVGKLTTIMGVSEARFHPNYTEVTLFVKLILPQSGANGKQKEIFFGADNVKISHSGGIYGDMNISLLGDIAIPINGNKALLELKGGFNMKTGVIDDKTYVTIDCSGIREIGIAADVIFSRDLLEPLQADFTPIKDEKVKVKGSFQTVVKDWNDILAEVTINYPFQIKNEKSTTGKGKAGLVFEVSNAIFDFSDLRNSENMQISDSYKEKYLIPGNEDLWRGVYIQAIKVSLPKEFQENGSNKRVTIGAENLLIDSEGITGEFSAENVLDLDKGNAAGWQFSVKSLYANLEANKLIGGGFGGHIVLPVSKEVTQQQVNSLSEEELAKKAIKYTAVVDVEEEEYSLTLEPLKQLEFNVFKAKATLESNSKIELKVADGKFRPKAILHGNLNINASNAELENGKKGIVDFKGVTFENLQLQTESPYFSVDYMGYSGEVKFARFPVTISEIGVTANDTKASLKFAIDVNLMGKGFAGGTKLDIVGKFQQESNVQRWKFDRVNIERINIAADLGAVKFKGLVDIKDDDPVYGDGFYGELEADFNKINVKATAWFGKTDVRYWYVDAYADLSSLPTKPMIGPVEINGFGGGAYYHMTKKSNPPKLVYEGKPVKTPGPPSGMDYVPDSNSGLGFRAMLGFALGNEKAFNGKIGFEMAFNKSGGLNRILFFGEAHIMKTIDFKFGDKFKKKLTAMQDKINDFGENNPAIQKLKETNLVEYSKVSFPQNGLTFDAGIDAHFSMEMDFVNRSFHAEMEVYLNTPGNFFSGVGPRGRAGWAVFHTGPDGWYIHMGTPKDRIGLRVGIGSFSVKATTYLMIGDKIPGSPPPPQAVADILGLQLDNLDYMRDLNALGDGRGFAIGMDLSVDTGEMSFLVFYARFRAGLGFDIMIKDYGETACKGSGQIGVDGWYANGQAYAYLEGELGIKINLWFLKTKIPIIKAGAAVLLQAKLPNPSWFRGYVGGHFSVLGGLISGKFRFKIELGDECEIVGGAPLGGLKIISGVTPDDGAAEVDVFATPQAAFNMKINKQFDLEDDSGVRTYRILLDEFTVKKDGNDIQGELNWNESKDVANYISFDVLPPKSTIKVKVAVSFQELKSGTWVTLLHNGKKAQEIEERTFTTGEAPDYIPMENIVYTYPVVEQKYFYQKESNTGYTKLKRGQPYLFSPETNWSQKVRYTSEDGQSSINNVSYDKGGRQVNYDFSRFLNSKKYTLTIISLPPGTDAGENATTYTEVDTGKQEGNSVKVRNKNVQNVVNNDAETQVLQFEFTTSKYDKFSDKLKDKDIIQHYLEPIYSDVHAIQTDVEDSERLDELELEGGDYTGREPLVRVEAVLDDSYYKDRIFPLIYKNYPLEPEFTVSRNTDELGLPPKKAVDILTWYVPYLKQNPTYSLLDRRIPFRYHLPYYYKKDFVDIQYKVVNKYLNEPEQYASQISKYNYIINGVFPAIRSGKYKVKMQYVLPGDKTGSNYIFKYKNPF
ncbi:hypothetical protein [Tenacibaculum agarivorans]|uniref:hypothetical protein n=1 Tax=Tenacibaculum agarivorans TaxID=1908389 RepID=UPI00094B82D0|nr:hypothetical protein [Tenacibaculum agarivorans]